MNIFTTITLQINLHQIPLFKLDLPTSTKSRRSSLNSACRKPRKSRSASEPIARIPAAASGNASQPPESRLAIFAGWAEPGLFSAGTHPSSIGLLVSLYLLPAASRRPSPLPGKGAERAESLPPPLRLCAHEVSSTGPAGGCPEWKRERESLFNRAGRKDALARGCWFCSSGRGFFYFLGLKMCGVEWR